MKEYFDLVKKGLLRITEADQDSAIQALVAGKARLESMSEAGGKTDETLKSQVEPSPIQITQ